jgi:cyclophilin family peptidyl-prolyl cis-trans isomerase
MFGVRKMTRIQALVANGLVWMLAVQAWAFWDRAEVLAQNPRVLLETSMGDLEVELYQKEAPKTVANFLSYVKKGHYDGTIFHRIIPNFVVQGGGLDPSMKERPTDDPIENESSNGLKNDSDLDKSKAIDRFGYCVFGKVIKGEDIVEKMAKSKTGLKAGNSDVPVEPIVLKKATILEPSKN